MAVRVFEAEATFEDRASAGFEGMAAKIAAVGQTARAAASPLVDVDKLLGQLHTTTGRASAGAGEFDRTLKRVTAEGLSGFVGQIPIAGTAVEGLVSRLSGFALVSAGVVGAGLGIIGVLKTMSSELDATSARFAGSSDRIVTGFAQAAARMRQIEAETAGDREGAARAGAEGVLKQIALERREKLAALAEEEKGVNQKIFWFGRLETLEGQLVDIARRRSEAESEAAAKTQVANAELAGSLATLAQDRAKAEQEALAKTTEAERQAARDRLAALQGFLATAKGALAQFGELGKTTAEKIDLRASLENARTGLTALEGLFKEGVITERDFAEETQRVVAALEKMGASGKQIGEVVPEAMKESVKATEKLSQAMVQAGNSFAQTAGRAREMDQAAKALDETLTGQSLDDSFTQVGEAAAQASQQVEDFVDAGDSGTVREQTNALEEYLIRLRRIGAGDVAEFESREETVRKLKSHRATLEAASEFAPEALGAIQAINAEIARLEGRGRRLTEVTAGGPGFSGGGGGEPGRRGQTPEERALLGPSALGELFESGAPEGFTLRTGGGGGGGAGFGGEDVAAIINALGPLFSAAGGRQNVFTGAPLNFDQMRKDQLDFLREVTGALGIGPAGGGVPGFGGPGVGGGIGGVAGPTLGERVRRGIAVGPGGARPDGGAPTPEGVEDPTLGLTASASRGAITINFHGTNIVESERRVYELSGEILRGQRDRQRRGF